MRLRVAEGAIFAFLIIIGSARAQGQTGSDESLKKAGLAATANVWSGLESAYRAGRGSGDLSRLKTELQRVFSEDETERRLTGLRWIGRHRNDLTYDEQEELTNLYIELHPSDATSATLRSTNARNRLAAAPRDERARFYWSAVRQGEIRIPGGDTLVRDIALGMAAADGLEEFEGAIKQYAEEINQRYPRAGYHEADLALILLRFRSGAATRRDGYRLHAERLAQLNDREFSEQMDSDAAFRQATVNVASLACEERESDVACRELGKIYGRQLMFQRARTRREPADGSAQGQSDGRPEPVWMSQFRKSTEGAWAMIELERQGQSRKAVR